MEDVVGAIGIVDVFAEPVLMDHFLSIAEYPELLSFSIACPELFSSSWIKRRMEELKSCYYVKLGDIGLEEFLVEIDNLFKLFTDYPKHFKFDEIEESIRQALCYEFESHYIQYEDSGIDFLFKEVCDDPRNVFDLVEEIIQVVQTDIAEHVGYALSIDEQLCIDVKNGM